MGFSYNLKAFRSLTPGVPTGVSFAALGEGLGAAAPLGILPAAPTGVLAGVKF